VAAWSFHPVPSDNHDRTIVVRLTAEAVVVDYRLELDEFRAQRDLPRSEIARIASRKDFYTVFTNYFAEVLPGNLVAKLDDRELSFTCERKTYEATDHLRCDYRFRAAWAPEPGSRHTFSFREGNHEDDDFSKLRLELTGDFQVRLLSSNAPDEALLDRPPADRKPGDGERLRRASGVFTLAEEGKGVYKPALPPDPEPYKNPPADGQTVASVKPGSGTDLASAKPGTEAAAEEESPLSPPHSLLHLLLDTKRGLAVALLLAAFFGAAHALTPGHGKTLVAAYLVGQRGTVWHALLLGLVVTLTHTGAVLVLAGLVGAFGEKAGGAAYTLLQLLGGLLIAGLGFWLLLRRLAGQADHVHLGASHHRHHHHHDHGHSHTHLPAIDAGTPGLRALVLLGVSGGIVPCWDAIALLLMAAAAQLFWLALPLLLAFSAGLAGVLIALGVGVVWARRWVVARAGEGDRLQTAVRLLPLASAALVTVIGLWMCYDSVRVR
jgi:ABC-type nickel/cobalt efflux system permease component RcnA